MKVITGVARGRSLLTVEGTDIVRPTTQKVKEAIFSVIQFDVPYAKVLDLFCGSGQMGIEALSRDAEFCVFVDSSKKSQDVTKQNLINTSLLGKSKIVPMDCKAYLLSTNDKFDIAFLDPPYSKGYLSETLTLLADRMNDNGIILCEHETIDIPPECFKEFKKVKQYNYGRICVTSYKKD